MEENCRRQVFGARSGARNERKVLFLIGIQRERLGGKVRPEEARFGPELDGEKPWRRQVACFGPELDGEKPWRRQVFGARSGARHERKVLFFNRGFRGSVWEGKCDQGRLVLDQN